MAETGLAFFGSSDFSRPVLKKLLGMPGFRVRLVISRPDQPFGRDHIISHNPLAALARQYSLKLLQPIRPSLELIQVFAANSIELAVVAAYGRIIPAEVLSAVPYGFVNIHPSLLPKYRGAAPIAQAILDNLNETGVTIMKMDAGLDTGPIISQRSCPISPHANRTSLERQLADLGADLLSECLWPYVKGQLKPWSQPEIGVSLTRPFKRSDGRVNWSDSAEQIERRWRALEPWPGIFTVWRDQNVKILECAAANLDSCLAPGTVWQSEDQPLVVRCGTGSLAIRRLQLAGGRPVDASDFLRGHAALIGSRFA